MQHLDRMLTSLDIREGYAIGPEEGTELNANNLYTYLSKVLYKRRSDFNPLWNQVIVAGLDEDSTPFLASADLLGTTFKAPCLATGFGSHLAIPLMRKAVPDEKSVENLSREDAEKLLRDCMKVLFYRDARSLDSFSIAVVEKGKGVDMKENEKLEKQSWAFAEGIRGYGTQVN